MFIDPECIPTNELPATVGHPFYQRLNQVLEEHAFDAFVEAQFPLAVDRVLRKYRLGMTHCVPIMVSRRIVCGSAAPSWPFALRRSPFARTSVELQRTQSTTSHSSKTSRCTAVSRVLSGTRRVGTFPLNSPSCQEAVDPHQRLRFGVASSQTREALPQFDVRSVNR
jgi:hypothetical protein